MTTYVFMILIWMLMFYYLLYQNTKLSEEALEKRKRWFAVLAGIVLFVVMGFRNKYVGYDTTQYLARYHATSYYKWNTFLQWELWVEKEYGFALVGKILNIFQFSDQMYLITYAFFISYSIAKLIQKYCKNPFWGFYLHTTIGLFTMSMSGIRQSIACCICWLALDYVFEKKPVRFFLAVLLASTFHQSAIFFVAFYVVRFFTIKRMSGWILAIVSASSIVLRSFLMPIIGIFLPQKYEKYGLMSDSILVNPLLIAIALLIPMFCLFFWERHKIKDEQEEKRYSMYYSGSFIYAVITVLSLSSPMISRMNQYFYIFNVILLGNIITDIEDRNTRYIASFFALVLPGYMFFKSQSLGISPYYFFWQIYGS